MSGWGKGSENNNIGWGQGAYTATNGWGESQKVSYAGDTDILGDPALGISYPASALCENASNPTPTVSGNEGSGTFSSTTGLVFVSTSTGEVNISSSTAGATYLITYTDTNAATATFSLTINNLDNAAFAYSASSYEPTGSDPTPTITGLSGGTFSSTSGLVFVDSGTNTGSSTGQIDLSATTEATYTITYDTTSSGSSVCPNTSTQSVEVAVAGIANNYSMSFDGTNDYIEIPYNSIFTQSVYSFSFWLKNNINSGASNDGIITADSSTRGWSILQDDQTFKFNPNISGGGAQIDVANFFNTTGTWIHCAITFDGTTLNVYKNGAVADFSSSGTRNLDANNNNLTIGYNNFSSMRYFNGSIDEVAIWNTSLTSTQVSEIYSATGTNLTKDLTTVSGSNLVYWNRMGD